MKRLFTRLSASLACVLALNSAAFAQLTPPSTLNLHSPGYKQQPLTPPSTTNLRYTPRPGRPGQPVPTANPKPRQTARPVAPGRATRPAVNPKPAANMPVVGAWRITSLRQFDAFDLSIERLDGTRFTYRTTMDSRPRLGNFFAATGMITFNHTDARGVTREFQGRIRQNATGRWTMQGTYTGGGGLAASHIFGGDLLR